MGDGSPAAIVRAWGRADLVAMLLLVAIVVATWAPRLRGPIDLRWDAGVYYVLGTSLYEGKGYRLVNEPGEIAALQYAPGLPAIVAAHQWVSGSASPADAGAALRRTMFAISILYTLGAYALARVWLNRLGAMAAGLITALHAWSLFMSDMCSPEIPFALIGTAALLIHARWRPSWRREMAVGTLVVTGLLLRGLGLALPVAWVIDAALQRQFARAAVRGSLAMIPFLAWQGYVWQVRHAPDYDQPAYAYQRAPYLMYNVSYRENMSLFDPFHPEEGPATVSRVAVRTARNILLVPAMLGEMVSAERSYWRQLFAEFTPAKHQGGVASAVALMLNGLGGLVIGGLALLAWRRAWLPVGLVVATLAMICLSPWVDQFRRYLTPLVPLLAIALVLALGGIARAGRRSGAPLVAAGAMLAAAAPAAAVAVIVPYAAYRLYAETTVAAVYFGPGGSERPYRLFFYDDRWAAFGDALKWLRRWGHSDAVVVTMAPHWTYLNTGLKAVLPPIEPDPAEAQHLIDTVPATYLILDTLNHTTTELFYRSLRGVSDRDPAGWRLAYQNATALVRVFERTPPPPAAPPRQPSRRSLGNDPAKDGP
jgi:hypothetical protein